MRNKKAYKAVSFVLAAGILAFTPAVSTQAAVITSNATDKLAVVFQEGTAYSAGDYVINDGEMYICTDDVQGAWSQAEASFMQITKNKELGRSEDLAAAYEDTKDPSEEKSLMAFAANAWQKLKGFLGIGSAEADIQDETQYKNASVSQKLNYLGEQNRQHRTNLNELDEWVKKSFQSVSSGKKLIADAITDNDGTAGPQNSFAVLSQAIRNMAQLKYNQGHDTGYGKGSSDGYTSGKKDGKEEGKTEGYQDGINFADNRLNPGSVSYIEGKKDGKEEGKNESGLKFWDADMYLKYDGPDMQNCPAELENCFSYGSGFSQNHRAWNFCYDLGPSTIYGISANVFYRDSYGSSVDNNIYVKSGDGYDSYSNGDICEMSFQNGRIELNGININVLYRNETYVKIHIAVIYV